MNETRARRTKRDLRLLLRGVAFSGSPPTAAELAELDLPTPAREAVEQVVPAIVEAAEQREHSRARVMAEQAAGTVDRFLTRPAAEDSTDYGAVAARTRDRGRGAAVDAPRNGPGPRERASWSVPIW